MAFFLRRILFFTILVFFPTLGWAETWPEKILVLRDHGNYAPMEYFDDTVRRGLHIEMVEHAADALSIDVQWQEYPWQRAIKLMQAGKADAITFLTPSQERTPYVTFDHGNILSYSYVSGLVVKSRLNEFAHYTGDLKQLAGFRIGVQAGFKLGEPFDTADYLIKIEVRNRDILLDRLKKGYVDIYATDTRLFYDTPFEFKERFQFLTPSFLKSVNFLSFSKLRQHEKLSLAFAAELKKLRASEKWGEILKKYDLNPQEQSLSEK